MVDGESLESLDFMLWMAGSQRAAALTHTNQSTVICRSRIVSSVFGTRIERTPLGWYDRGNTDLLKMERALHQQSRFLGRKPLRLHIPFWSQEVLSGNLPIGWNSNPIDPCHPCENVLDLLRGKVVDACILTPTQLDESSQDLFCIELYQSLVDLIIFSPGSPQEPSSLGGGLDDLLSDGHSLALKIVEFLPRSCRQASRFWFQKMPNGVDPEVPFSADRPRSVVEVAFLTPEMRRAVASPFLVDSSQVRAYRETLVILRENAHEPRFLELFEAVQPAFAHAAGLEEPSWHRLSWPGRR